MKFTLTCNGVQAGIPTINERVYTRETLEKMIQRVNERGPSRSMLGMLGAPSDGKTRLSECSHIVLGASFDAGGRMAIDVEVMDTPGGRMLLDLLNSERQVDILPRGTGSCSDGKIGEDYILTTFDVVMKEGV